MPAKRKNGARPDGTAPESKRGGAARHLVVVESPSKARTLGAYLGTDYTIVASKGHVRDLPKSGLGVAIEADFRPAYVTLPDRKDALAQIRAASRKADMVFLATDPDREGEAISWHIVEGADLRGLPHRRVVFHEITRDAILEAFRHPRDIDEHLVDAQQARRILDRLVGYRISPVLWKRVRRGLSAGRVQSVALRMIVDREREIQAFQPQEYWTVEAALEKAAAPPFRARLVGYHDEKASGKRKKAEQVPLGSEGQARAVTEVLRRSTVTVLDVKRRDIHERPSPPFTTSTMQQEASRRLGWTATRTMRVAQHLYEGLPLGAEGDVGLITYMRTDSVSVAQVARDEARRFIAERFGHDFLPAKPREYRTRARNAQEAHEAIRPTSALREPERVRRHLTGDQFRLYQLIWQRFVASQMADAVYDQEVVEFRAAAAGERPFLLRTTARVIRFPGFRQVYAQGANEQPSADSEPTVPAIPRLAADDVCRVVEVYPEQHFTEPPARYGDATLIKALEENGIGRPSTYAPIIQTVIDRGYVERHERQLRPSELGMTVSDLLVAEFPDVVNTGFTAHVEEHLDEIASGQRPWVPVVRAFYEPLERAIEKAEKRPYLHEHTEHTCDVCGRAMVKRWGRFGQFLSCSGYPECKSRKPLPEEQQALDELQQRAAGEQCPECGSPMTVRRGRFGPFLACTRYPDCKGSRPLLDKIGFECRMPGCGGDIVRRRSRNRRGLVYYACSNAPKCSFVAFAQPLDEGCPRCDRSLVTDKRYGKRCSDKECGWHAGIDAAAAVEVGA